MTISTKNTVTGCDWVKALTFTERAESLRPCSAESKVYPVDQELARRQLDRWYSRPPFNGDQKQFTKRLLAEEVTQEALLYLLQESSEQLSRRLRPTPDWITELESGVKELMSGKDVGGADDFNEDTTRPGGFISGFLKRLLLITRAIERFRQKVTLLCDGAAVVPFNPETVVEIFLPSLLGQLSNLSLRTLILEVNVARLEQKLEGDTPEARFEHFSQLISQPEPLTQLLKEYPVLAREIFRTTERWLNTSVELLARLTGDLDELTGKLSPHCDLGHLEGLSASAGDSHRGGRSVSILTFDSGLKLVYKPRPMSVDIHFNELLAWLNARGTHPPFRTTQTIDRGEYGWSEFVRAEKCTNEEEVHLFYRRQGGLLALLYALEASDVHYENLIASGEQPVLIDLESLFQPRVARKIAMVGMTPAIRAIAESVLSIGLLPRRMWGLDGKDGIDLSGMGGAPGQMTPFNVLTYENPATDEVKVVRKRMAIEGSQNRPGLEGREIDLQEYAEDVIAGFKSIYELLLREREQLLSDDGPLLKFKCDKVRAIVRPTIYYASLLKESFHPDFLRDALERQKLLDRVWGMTKEEPRMSRIARLELRDLQQGDIPYFSCLPDSRDIWSSGGDRIADFFEEDALSLVRGKLLRLSEEDASRQSWFISASIASLSPGVRTDNHNYLDRETTAGPVTRERLLAATQLVARRLEQLAIREGAHANWIGMSFFGESQWVLLPLVDDLYNGVLGVALFLAYAGRILEEEGFTELSRLVIDGVRERLNAYKADSAAVAAPGLFVGGYAGLGGAIYALAHLGTLWRDQSLVAEAESLVEFLPPLIDADESLDIMSGSAGCILNLLALYCCSPSESTLRVARMCGDKLVERASQVEAGAVAWPNPLAVRPLTGFSHGAAGIAYALLELARVTGDERYRQTASAAFDYERGVFSPEAGNWPDFRTESIDEAAGAVPYMVTWCHGAPGVGLSRLFALREGGDDERILREIRDAAETTLRAGFGFNHSTCHGDMGNVEFLFEAGRILGDTKLLEEAEKVLSAILSSVEKRGWICGTPRGTETPGLMPGLAGIGFGLLRLAERERVPSMLTLSPPAQAVIDA